MWKNEIGKKRHSFLNFLSKFQILIPSKIKSSRGNEIEFNEIATKTPKISLYFNILFFKKQRV